MGRGLSARLPQAALIAIVGPDGEVATSVVDGPSGWLTGLYGQAVLAFKELAGLVVSTHGRARRQPATGDLDLRPVPWLTSLLLTSSLSSSVRLICGRPLMVLREVRDRVWTKL